jgi:hypothetical protein
MTENLMITPSGRRAHLIVKVRKERKILHFCFVRNAFIYLAIIAYVGIGAKVQPCFTEHVACDIVS